MIVDNPITPKTLALWAEVFWFKKADLCAKNIEIYNFVCYSDGVGFLWRPYHQQCNWGSSPWTLQNAFSVPSHGEWS
jgi:hypothetical protein